MPPAPALWWSQLVGCVAVRVPTTTVPSARRLRSISDGAWHTAAGGGSVRVKSLLRAALRGGRSRCVALGSDAVIVLLCCQQIQGECKSWSVVGER